MARLLRDAVAARADEPAVVDERGAIGWADLDDRVNRWIAVLRAGGLDVGDRVAIVAGNRRETFEALLACVHTGLTIVPVNWNLTAPEIAYLLADSGSRAVIADEARSPVVTAALAGLDDAPPLRLCTGTVDSAALRAVEPLLARDAAEPPGQCSGGLMLYTSGTTGAPKGVVNRLLTAGADLERVRRLLAALGRTPGLPDRAPVLLVGPWYHSAQLFFALFPLLRGARLVMRHRFDPAETLRLIDAERITTTHLVPTQFVRMLRLDPAERAAFDGTSLTRVWHGGGPCPPHVKREMIDWWGPVLVEYYAATEAGIVTLIDSADWLARPGSVGRALPSSDLVIVDEDGRPLPPGREGRVFIRRAPEAGFTYHNAEEKTRKAYLAPGTFTYGDLGRLDEDGYLYLTGRDHGTIVSGGVNVYPAEVEAVLLSHPAVRDAAVYGVPDEEFGERVAALVEVAPSTVDGDLPRVLDAHCRQRLAGFKVPRSYELTAALPRDPSGKLRRAGPG